MSNLRIPRDRQLTFSQMLSMACTVGAVIWGAAYLLVRWVLS